MIRMIILEKACQAVRSLYIHRQVRTSKQRIILLSVMLHYMVRQAVKHLSMVLPGNVSVSATQVQQPLWKVLAIMDVNI